MTEMEEDRRIRKTALELVAEMAPGLRKLLEAAG